MDEIIWEEIGTGSEVGGFTEKIAWLPEKKGDAIEGQYMDTYKIKKGTRKEKNVYVLECADGKQYSVFGGAVLDGKFKEITIGDFVKIVYQGMKEGKEFEYRDYQFFRKKNQERITVETVQE